MKGFFSAAAAAFISGILLLLIGPFVQSRAPTVVEKAHISLSKNDNLVQIDRDTAQAMSRFFSEGDTITQSSQANQRLSLNTATIRNTGTTDVQNFGVTIRSSVQPEAADILAVGRIGEHPTDLDRDVQIDNNGERINLRFPLLRHGEEYSLWYIFRPFNLTEISARVPNVEITEQLATPADLAPQQNSGDSFPWDLVLSLLFAVASFFLGMGLCAYFYEQILRKVGLDPKEVMDLYQKAQREKSSD